MVEYVKIRAPKRQRDWEHLRVRLDRPTQTGSIKIAAGTIGTVDHAAGGIVAIQFDPCQCCGSAPRLRIKAREQRGTFSFVEPRMIVPSDGAVPPIMPNATSLVADAIAADLNGQR